jgi:hypothetical protein
VSPYPNPIKLNATLFDDGPLGLRNQVIREANIRVPDWARVTRPGFHFLDDARKTNVRREIPTIGALATATIEKRMNMVFRLLLPVSIERVISANPIAGTKEEISIV